MEVWLRVCTGWCTVEFFWPNKLDWAEGREIATALPTKLREAILALLFIAGEVGRLTVVVYWSFSKQQLQKARQLLFYRSKQLER